MVGKRGRCTRCLRYGSAFFFLQAEDGIRDLTVTGVQTCALPILGRLLSGPAPLRGRAGLELVVHPFGYRDAARFWEITDPKLAVLVHSVVGGTPAYRRELLREDTPANLADFDAWVIRTVLNPQTPLFREARYLLAEETEIGRASCRERV